MLFLDDILFAPANGILWIFEEIHKAAQAEMLSEADSITDQLRNLYMALESHNITDAQFDAGEKVLLDRLDSIEARGELQADEEEEQEENEVFDAALS